MTFDEWVKNYNGKAIDYDGGAGVQCVDLAKLYFDKVLGIKPISIGNAEAYWRRYEELGYLHNNFQRIPNFATFIPKKGDVVLWDTKHGKYGHIAVATGEGTTSWFNSYDQNWKTKPMHLVKHSYRDGFAGVLRPYNQSNINQGSKYQQGQAIEINTPMYFTGAKQGNKYQYDTKGEITWISENVRSLIKNDRLIARATYVFDKGDGKSAVQVFNDQFLIKNSCIVKAL